MADCDRRTTVEGLVMYDTAKICMAEAMESRRPITANLCFGIASWSGVIGDRSGFINANMGMMYANETGT